MHVMQTFYQESTIIDKDINTEHQLKRGVQWKLHLNMKCISQKFKMKEQNGGLHKIHLAFLSTNIIKNYCCLEPTLPAPPTFSSYYFFLGLYISLIVKNSSSMSYNICTCKP
jgi:type II secretory pathway component GspD/PulD (secretin)